MMPRWVSPRVHGPRSCTARNLTDTRAILSSSYTEWVKANTINRPRTLGLRFSFKFTENR